MEYKEQDRQYLSRQLNGPVVTGFATAIYNFLHSFVDDTVEYFDNLSIGNAKSDQLTFIGKLMGIPRFYVFQDSSLSNYLTFYSNYFKITQTPYNGFSDDYVQYDGTTGWNKGGIFAGDSGNNFLVQIPTELFRSLLLVVSEATTSTINSIYYIDKITNIVLNSTEYTIAYDAIYKNKINITISSNVNVQYAVILSHFFDILYNGLITIEIIKEA